MSDVTIDGIEDTWETCEVDERYDPIFLEDISL